MVFIDSDSFVVSRRFLLPRWHYGGELILVCGAHSTEKLHLENKVQHFSVTLDAPETGVLNHVFIKGPDMNPQICLFENLTRHHTKSRRITAINTNSTNKIQNYVNK